MYGLLDKDINYIINTLIRFQEIEKAIIFVSRARKIGKVIYQK